MKKLNFWIRAVLLIFISITLVTCGGEDDELSSETLRTVEDVREDFSKLTFNVGINDVTLESNTDGTFWNFRVIVPEGASTSNKMPLIMYLHGGASESTTDTHKSSSCLVVPGFEALDAYIIIPNSNRSVWYSVRNSIQVEAIVDLATQNFHIDENKIVVTGYSDGGNGSWHFAEYYSDIFSASIPMASAYHNTDSEGNVSAIGIPMYVIHGTNDELFPIERSKGWVDEYIAAGSDISFVVAEGLGHLPPCDYVPYLKDAVTWLQTEVWD